MKRLELGANKKIGVIFSLLGSYFTQVCVTKKITQNLWPQCYMVTRGIRRKYRHEEKVFTPNSKTHQKTHQKTPQNPNPKTPKKSTIPNPLKIVQKHPYFKSNPRQRLN